jgi:eukaryotic-like serine/threonine-protein kinase
MAYCVHCDEEHGEGVDFCPKTGRPIIDVVERLLGRTIAGRYKLTRCIGQGGMGTIFEAEHTLIGSKVAVKLLHETFAAQREPVQRLYREARATGAIGHPNIIKVHDVGETSEGVPFLVMELLEGESLGAHIERTGPLPIKFVFDVAEQMLSALNAAHGAGIIHRDLKSDNVFLPRAGSDRPVIKILDFGISKFIDPEAENLKLTQTGSVLGTPYYMSPEQASGKKDLDHRIDLYSAGIILYECLVGAIPHTASNYNALLIQIITQDVKPFRRIRPDVPEALEAAVLRSLSRRREDRWQTAVDFSEAILAIRRSLPFEVLHGAPIVQRESRPADRDSSTVDIGDVLLKSKSETPLAFESRPPPEPPRSRSRRIAAGFVASFVVVLFAAAGVIYSIRGGESAPPPPAAPQSARGAVRAGDADAGTPANRAKEGAAAKTEGAPDDLALATSTAAPAAAQAGKKGASSKAGAKKSAGPKGGDGAAASTGRQEGAAGTGARKDRKAAGLDTPMDNPF